MEKVKKKKENCNSREKEKDLVHRGNWRGAEGGGAAVHRTKKKNWEGLCRIFRSIGTGKTPEGSAKLKEGGRLNF